MENYRQAVSVLPQPLRTLALQVEAERMARTEEVRLRLGRLPTLVLPEGELPIPCATSVSAEDLERLVDAAGRWSVHAVLEQLRQGYLSVEGGHRLGLCGTVVMEGDRVHALRDLSGANLRIARQIRGVAEPVAQRLLEESAIPNTLILAPPGAGKTTLLRDLIRCISCRGIRVAAADERGELSAVYGGISGMDLGPCTDVLSGCPKALAIPMLLRGMNPGVIAVDEITRQEDVLAMEQAVGCGVALLATAHGGGVEDLRRRPIYKQMMDKSIFRVLVIIRVEGGQRHIQVNDAEDLPW